MRFVAMKPRTVTLTASVDFGVAFFPVALGDFDSFFSEVGVALVLAFGVGVAFDFEAILLFLG